MIHYHHDHCHHHHLWPPHHPINQQELTKDLQRNNSRCLLARLLHAIAGDALVLEDGEGQDDELAAIGRVFDVIGPVTRPYYCVRFNSEEHIRSKNLKKGQQMFFAPKTEHTAFVFLEQLMKMKISDASW